MIEVAGFAWWDQLIPKNLRERAIEIEKSSGKNEVKLHHPIEFTMFDGLIEIVTAEYTEWSKEKPLTVSDLEELLNKYDSIEKLKDGLANKSKTISIWEDVFSNYFDDKETWYELKEKIKDRVIPIRNKVMHHRLLRVYEVNQLEEYRTQLNRTIRGAKRKMTKEKLSKAFKKWSSIFEDKMFQIDPEILKAVSTPIIPPATIKAMQEIGVINISAIQKFLEAKEFQRLYFEIPDLKTGTNDGIDEEGENNETDTNNDESDT